MVQKIYLDVCALCRPYDDQSYMRINFETIAVQLIFSAIDQNMYDLVYWPVHVKEISAISKLFQAGIATKKVGSFQGHFQTSYWFLILIQMSK